MKSNVSNQSKSSFFLLKCPCFLIKPAITIFFFLNRVKILLNREIAILNSEHNGTSHYKWLENLYNITKCIVLLMTIPNNFLMTGLTTNRWITWKCKIAKVKLAKRILYKSEINALKTHENKQSCRLSHVLFIKRGGILQLDRNHLIGRDGHLHQSGDCITENRDTDWLGGEPR